MAAPSSRPVTDYPTPTPAWEDRFREYQYGALYFFPPEPFRQQVTALRARYDPRSHAYCEAHISLTVPLPQPLTQADAAAFAAVARTLDPFPLRVGPLRSYPGIPGVVLHIEPVDHLTALVQRFEACAAFAAAPPRRYPFSPHMTIAEFITLERTAALLAELPPETGAGTFLCEQVSYAVPDQHFRFTERLSWPLGG
jgi:2'-5' RNA ligase